MTFAAKVPTRFASGMETLPADSTAILLAVIAAVCVDDWVIPPELALNVNVPFAAVIVELIAIAVAPVVPVAFSVNSLMLLQATGEATVIIPLPMPPPPVAAASTITLPLPSAAWSVVTLKVEPADPTPLNGLVVPFMKRSLVPEIVISEGSSSSVPAKPRDAAVVTHP